MMNPKIDEMVIRTKDVIVQFIEKRDVLLKLIEKDLIRLSKKQNYQLNVGKKVCWKNSM